MGVRVGVGVRGEVGVGLGVGMGVTEGRAELVELAHVEDTVVAEAERLELGQRREAVERAQAVLLEA